ncbi:hypothetical protein LL686_003911 [Salmonella enterica]|nr:hypothetical protein [Salmonella enterica subsp. enterica]ECL6016555.1 hypothetical protein [Salmonella enterica]EEM0288935.1 hypothetical protein [Salmonella enterica subsp. enterica serovar Sandiego]ECC9711350.1 hypothetical protein [Salmonella enterica subsp. enterica]EDF9460575.1 hypothetical protein [Salmonella enterica]
MNTEQGREVKIYPRCFPESNHYFQTGISGIVDRLSNEGCSTSYIFIHLNRYTLAECLLQFPNFNEEDDVIIISTPQLMPVAVFWLTENRHVRAVFKSTTSMDEVINTISDNRLGDKMLTMPLKRHHMISLREMQVLKQTLEGHSLNDLQETHYRPASTIHGWKAGIARKLGVRKLRHIFS